MTKLLAALAVLALGVGAASLATAASQKDTFDLTANLKARSEVPKPTGARPGATGLFTGKAVEGSNDQARLTWRLTFSRLTGSAIAAHIHTARPGRSGPVLVALCGPCRNGQRGAVTLSHAQLNAIRSGGTYVNVHTKKNAGGEIRGQLKASGGSSTDSTPTTTTITTTPGPVYP